MDLIPCAFSLLKARLACPGPILFWGFFFCTAPGAPGCWNREETQQCAHLTPWHRPRTATPGGLGGSHSCRLSGHSQWLRWSPVHRTAGTGPLSTPATPDFSNECFFSLASGLQASPSPSTRQQSIFQCHLFYRKASIVLGCITRPFSYPYSTYA